MQFDCFNRTHCIGGIMVSVLASSVVDRGFRPRLGQTKDFKIGIWLHIEGRIRKVRVMVFNAIFNSISVISWQSVLLVEETRVPGENH
jgi:hypothetical protein